MVFKAARRDGAVVEDPSEFVDTIRQGQGIATEKRRPFTVPEIQAVLAVADDEWRSMVRFGLYSGQRLADLASLTWANLDLARGEIRLETRKTGRRMILPMAGPLRKHIEGLKVGDKPDAPVHPRAFAIVAREKRSGSLSNQFGDLLSASGPSFEEEPQQGRGRRGEKRSA